MAAPLTRFRRDETGAASVELVVWLPFFLGLFFLLVDTSVTFFQYARMWDTARDGARQMSVGTLGRSQEELDNFVAARLGSGFTGVFTGGSTTSLTVSISGTSEAMGVFGIVSSVAGGLDARVTMATEPNGSV